MTSYRIRGDEFFWIITQVVTPQCMAMTATSLLRLGVESDVGKTHKVTESKQATIDAVEDDQEDVEEYLDAFDSDESAGRVNADLEGKQFEDVPLYNGASVVIVAGTRIQVMWVNFDQRKKAGNLNYLSLS